MREAAALGAARYPRDAEINLLCGVALTFTKPAIAPWQIGATIALDKGNRRLVVMAAYFLTVLGQVEAARNYVEHAKTLPADEAVRAGLAEVDRRVIALEAEAEQHR
jgi:hypothetical protein